MCRRRSASAIGSVLRGRAHEFFEAARFGNDDPLPVRGLRPLLRIVAAALREIREPLLLLRDDAQVLIQHIDFLLGKERSAPPLPPPART